MPFRFVTKSIHAYLIDYTLPIILLVAPFVLKLGQSGPVAIWLSVITAVAALNLAMLTNHPTGLIKIMPYPAHLWVDRTIGLVFLAAVFMIGFTGIDGWYYGVLGVAVVLTTSIFNAPERSVSAHGATSAGDTICIRSCSHCPARVKSSPACSFSVHTDEPIRRAGTV